MEGEGGRVREGGRGEVEGDGDGEQRAGPDGCRGEGDAVLARWEVCERTLGLEGVQACVRVLGWVGVGSVGRGGLGKRLWEVVSGEGEVVYS